MSTATNAVVENKMAPVQKAPLDPQTVVTGQGLYNAFIGDADREALTRMELIKSLTGTADAVQITGATDKMVELARAADVANGMEDVKANRGPKQRSAMNVRTNIRNIWGAFKFTGFQMCGYNEACVSSKVALADAGIKWTGERAKTDADRAQAKTLKEQKAQQDAVIDAIKRTPRLPNESDTDWQIRYMEKARVELEEARQKANTDKAQALYDQLAEDGVAFELFKLLANRFGFEVATEPTEEEANAALLAQAMDEGKVEMHEEEEQVVEH